MRALPELRPNLWDALVALAVVVLAVVCVATIWFDSTDAGLEAVIIEDGTEQERISLDTLKEPTELVVEANGYHLYLTLSSEGVVMAESDCPTQDCVHTGTIRRSGQSIVCLPARVVVSLEGAATDDGPDLVIG